MKDNPINRKAAHSLGHSSSHSPDPFSHVSHPNPIHAAHSHAEGQAGAISDTEKLKRKVQKISAVLDFYEALKNRKAGNERDLRDSRQKMEFAKKQILKLCIEGKKIIKDAENKERL